MPFALYRMPYSNNIVAELGLKAEQQFSIQASNTTRGFVFSPFNNHGNTKNIYFKTVLAYSSKNKKLEVLTGNSHKQLSNDFLQLLEDNKRVDIASMHIQKRVAGRQPSVNDFLKVARNAIDSIKLKTFEKVVLALRREIKLLKNFDILNLYNTLECKYTSQFVSLVSIPDVGTWIGASPEKLLSYEQGHFETISLAGTKKVNGGSTNWTSKEFDEQRLVTNYIEELLIRGGIHNYTITDTETIKAGNIEHLQTRLNINNLYNPDKVNYLLNNLHPTPAMAGVPKQESLHFIDMQEKFDREYYSGYLGPVNNASLHLYVNIRCMQLLPGYAFLYSGAGITKDSIPEEELEEIELKFKSIQDMLETAAVKIARGA